MVALLWLVGIIVAIPVLIMVAWQILGVIFALMKDLSGLIVAILFFVVICVCAGHC